MRTRDDALAALAEHPYDVLVIGGGITGAGVALDAASRGYSVALVEQADFASGTSSRSSKLVHGGLRYLQNFDLGLVREALLERQLMVRLAPHLVRPLPFVVPAFDGAPARPADRDRPEHVRRDGRAVRCAGGAARGGPRRPTASRTGARRATGSSTARRCSRLLPAIAHRRPERRLPVLRLPDRRRPARAHRAGGGGALRRDLRQPAAGHRAAAASEGSGDGGHGARRRRRAARSPSAPTTSSTPPACGPTGSAPTSCTPRPRCRRSRPAAGTHVILRREDLPLDAGAIVPAGDGRSIFALPWLGRSLIGTTDNNYEGDIDHVQPSAQDVDYLLGAVNEFFGTSLRSATRPPAPTPACGR